MKLYYTRSLLNGVVVGIVPAVLADVVASFDYLRTFEVVEAVHARVVFDNQFVGLKRGVGCCVLLVLAHRGGGLCVHRFVELRSRVDLHLHLGHAVLIAV